MQAIVLDAPGSAEGFRLVDIPMPTLRPGDVQIKVKAISFNPVDHQVRRQMPAGSPAGATILGRDLSGVVDAVHADVTELAPGDEVYSYVCRLASSGTYAEYVSVPAELVARKPRRLTFEQAAAVPVAGITAMLALQGARAGPGRSLFVAGGAGGVGTFAIRLARHLGVESLIATAGSEASRAYLVDEMGLGRHQIVDYRDHDFVARSLAQNGGPFDVVLDLVGGTMLAAGCRLLALEGHLASVTEAPGREDFEQLFEKNASFHAVGAHAYSLTHERSHWRRYRDMLAEFANLFDEGLLRPPRVTRMGAFSVQAVQRAHDLMERSAVQGKLVMPGP